MTKVGLALLFVEEDEDCVCCWVFDLDMVGTKADCVLLDGNERGRGVIDILGC